MSSVPVFQVAVIADVGDVSTASDKLGPLVSELFSEKATPSANYTGTPL
jgi:hypothetical protein